MPDRHDAKAREIRELWRRGEGQLMRDITAALRDEAKRGDEALALLREIHNNRTMRHYDSAMHDRIDALLDAEGEAGDE